MSLIRSLIEIFLSSSHTSTMQESLLRKNIGTYYIHNIYIQKVLGTELPTRFLLDFLN